jgi:predicted signal transduction protein with EAL and GGDEF domain
MSYKGRILNLLGFMLVGASFTFYNFILYGHVEWSYIKVMMFIIATALAWFNGKQYDKAKYYSEKDPLTGIYNRRYGEKKFIKLKEKMDRSKEKLAIFVVDIDEFKSINDTFGHQIGDDILKKVINQIKSNLY